MLKFVNKLKIRFKYFRLRSYIKFRDKEHKLLIIDFIKWIVIDIVRAVKLGTKKPHLYGIRCVTGMYGHGKSVTMSRVARDLRAKYGNDIYICSNYGLSIQDFPFKNIEQLTKQYDKNIIYFWDEVQNDFPSTEKIFPRAVRQALTLCRKGNGKAFYWASQDHELVHKTIRRLTIEYLQVRTFWHRLTRVKHYHSLDYQLLFESNDVEERHKIKPFKKWKFIQSDALRKMYNSYAYDSGEELLK